jgi:pimeloyl-ACP methyl ester carboxylesterase
MRGENMTSNKHSVWAYEPPAGREPVRQLVKVDFGYETVVYRFDPPADAPQDKLPVVMVHGIQSHPGWYSRSSLALADAGHTVYLPTRCGSGENTRARGSAVNTKQLNEAIDTIAGHVHDETGSQKMHFVGISWGGKHLSVAMAERKFARWSETLTLLCPGIVAKIKPPLAQRIGRALFGTLVPYLVALVCVFMCGFILLRWLSPEILDPIMAEALRYLVPMIWFSAGMTVLCLLRIVILYKQFPIPLNDPALFTDTPARREYLATNPETLHNVTGGFGFVNARMDRLVRKARKLSMPTTLVLAETDRIIDNEKTIPLVQAMREDVNIVTLPGCHTLEFEEEITPLVDAILASFDRGES